MKVYITYFYKIRDLPQNVIPLSTALWDPKFFHSHGDNSVVFVDKRGVVNGLRCEELHPDIHNSDCMRCKHMQDPNSCSFLTKYYQQLQKLDFQKLMQKFQALADLMKQLFNTENADVCLLVYEKPDNRCSERTALKKWFAENGQELIEWQ